MKDQLRQIWILPISLLGMLLFIQNPLHAQQLFLLAGQSNAGGLGDSAKSNQHLNERAFEYDVLLNQVKPLKDPAGQKWKSLEKVNGRGTILPAFTKQLSSMWNKQIVVVHAARSGSSCHSKAELAQYGTWDTTGKLFTDTEEKTKLAEKASGLKLSGILWMQGERDANAIHDGKLQPEEYKTALLDLINRFRNSFGANTAFYIIQTGYQSGRIQDGNDSVRAMQSELAKQLKAVYIVYAETNLFFERGWMHDFVHYNQQGLDDIGFKSAIAIDKIVHQQ